MPIAWENMKDTIYNNKKGLKWVAFKVARYSIFQEVARLYFSDEVLMFLGCISDCYGDGERLRRGKGVLVADIRGWTRSYPASALITTA